jgi:hypothetical protein
MKTPKKIGEDFPVETMINVLGRGVSNMSFARHHAHALWSLRAVADDAQWRRIKAKIKTLTVNWGNVLGGKIGEEFLPEKNEAVQLTARWLSNRRNFEALAPVLSTAANLLKQGQTNLAEIHDQAFAQIKPREIRTPSYQTFIQWLGQLHMIQRKSDGAGWDIGIALQWYGAGADDLPWNALARAKEGADANL